MENQEKLEMPTFDFSDVDVTETDVEAATVPDFTSKYFGPGKYDLAVVESKLKSQNKTDPSWYCYEVVLGEIDGERKIKHYLMVPTRSPKFMKPGIKQPLFLFLKFREAMHALGERCSIEDLKTLVPTLFGSDNQLVGRTLTVDIGYTGHYVGYVAKGQYRLYEKDGRDFLPEGKDLGVFPDKASATLEAANHGIVVENYVSVLKFHEPLVYAQDTNPWENSNG